MNNITEDDLKIMQYYAKETKILRKKLIDGTFFHINNKKYINDLFNDSKISEEKCENKSPKIGDQYQVKV